MSVNAKIVVLAPSVRDLVATKQRLEAIGVVVIVAHPAEVKFDVLPDRRVRV